MAKTESTAVNQLIELVATQKPLPPDPTEDLMFSEPKKVSAPRVTATVPPVRGAGEVEPLPRSRAPSGTQSGNMTAQPPPVRMSTMPPGRSTTIPPLGGNKAHSTPPPLPPNQTLTGTARPASAPATLPPLAPPSLNPRNTALGTMSNPGIAPPPVPRSASNPGSALPPQNLHQTVMGTGAVTSNPGIVPPAAPPVQNLRSTSLGTTANAAATMPPLTLPAEAPLTLPAEPPVNQTAMGVQPAENRTRPSLPPAVRPSAPLHLPVAAPFEPTKLPPGEQPVYGATPLDMTSHQAWFEQTELDMKTGLPSEQSVGTHQVSRRGDWKPLAGKLIVPMLCLMMLGVFVGGYIAFDDKGKRGTHAATPAKVAYKAPDKKVADKAEPKKARAEAEKVAAADETKAEKAVADETPKAEDKKEDVKTEDKKDEVKADEKKVEETKVEEKKETKDTDLAAKTTEPRPEKTEVKTEKTEKPKTVAALEPGKKPALVDVRINSAPQGATVMLVDRGKTLFLGTTPLQTSVDPSRKYELVFTYTNKPTQVEPFDPTSSKVINVVIGKSGTQAVKAVEAPKKVEAPMKVEAPKVEKKVEVPKVAPKTTVAAKVEKPAEAPKAAQMGVLMISSKPPCEIWIDGRPTGLMTPQREIKLSVGTHMITLVNAAENIKKTVAVSITADQPTKVIQNLMK